jgi:hypothetical protein
MCVCVLVCERDTDNRTKDTMEVCICFTKNNGFFSCALMVNGVLFFFVKKQVVRLYILGFEAYPQLGTRQRVVIVTNDNLRKSLFCRVFLGLKILRS